MAKKRRKAARIEPNEMIARYKRESRAVKRLNMLAVVSRRPIPPPINPKRTQ
jgi:hypothetical protein